MFLGTLVAERYGVDLADYLGLHFFLADRFNAIQLVTYMFMHGGFQHILFNMFALWMFGCVVERVWGPKKFLFYYIACGVGAGLFQEAAQYITYVAKDMAAYDYVSVNGARITMEQHLKDASDRPEHCFRHAKVQKTFDTIARFLTFLCIISYSQGYFHSSPRLNRVFEPLSFNRYSIINKR